MQTKQQKNGNKLRSRKRKAGWKPRNNHQKAPDRWQENYERLRLVLGSLIESQGGEIKIAKAVCEQYDVTQVLNVVEGDDGDYVLTLERPLGEKKPEEGEVDGDGGEQPYEVEGPIPS